MHDNQVWNLVDPPAGIKPIGCKWVFKKKTDVKGNVITYKARLVAKGYRQRQGIDFDEARHGMVCPCLPTLLPL